MAIPGSVETPRLRELHNLVEASTESGWADWPDPRDGDYLTIGKIVALYSYIDVNLRRIVEAAANASILESKYAGRVSKLRIHEVEDAVRSLPEVSEANLNALNQ